MDENNLFENNNEETADAVENTENIENEQPIPEQDEDTVAILNDEPTEESFAEETDEAFDEPEGESAEQTESGEFFDGGEVLAEEPKKSKKGLVLAIVLTVIVAVIVVALGAYIVYSLIGNKYNKMGYLDVEGETIKDIAEQMDLSVEDFKKQYNLPEDMPENTNSNAASNMIPIKTFLEMYNTDFATFKETFHLPETTSPAKPKNIFEKIKAVFIQDKPVEITEDTPIGIAQDEVEIKYLVGEENIDQLRETHGFGEEVTGETKYKEIRPQLEKNAIKERLEQEKAAKEKDDSENNADNEQNADGEANTENTDNADSAAQTETDTQNTDTTAESTTESTENAQ